MLSLWRFNKDPGNGNDIYAYATPFHLYCLVEYGFSVGVDGLSYVDFQRLLSRQREPALLYCNGPL